MRSQNETIQNHQKRGKTRVTKTQLVLDLNLIGGGKEARFLDQSQSAVNVYTSDCLEQKHITTEFLKMKFRECFSPD